MHEEALKSDQHEHELMEAAPTPTNLAGHVFDVCRVSVPPTFGSFAAQGTSTTTWQARHQSNWLRAPPVLCQCFIGEGTTEPLGRPKVIVVAGVAVVVLGLVVGWFLRPLKCLVCWGDPQLLTGCGGIFVLKTYHTSGLRSRARPAQLARKRVSPDDPWAHGPGNADRLPALLLSARVPPS